MPYTVQVWQTEGWGNTERTVALIQAFADRLGMDVAIERTVVQTDEDVLRHLFLGSPTVRIGGLDVEPAMREATDYAFG